MARLSSKHQQQVLVLNDFSGGLNTLLDPENIAENELQRAENWEYDSRTGRFKVVDGVLECYNAEITVNSIYYDEIHKEMLFTSGKELYKTTIEFESHELIGELTGDMLNPIFVAFGDNILIASGGALQAYNGEELITTKSPDAEIVFVRFGRVIVSNSSSDYLYYSAVGDAASDKAWSDESSDDSSSKSLQIGYKDGGTITGLAPLSSDIIIFKSNNMIYRLTNEYPNWVVSEVSRNNSCFNHNCCLQVNNDMFFFGRNGFCSLSTVFEYGSVKASEPGRKVNNTLMAVMQEDVSCLWHLPNKNQIIIKPNNDNYLWIYNYVIGAFTMRKTNVMFNHMIYCNDECYVASGTKIGRLSSVIATENGVNIVSVLESKIFTSDNYYLVKKGSILLGNIVKGTGYGLIDKLMLPLEFGDSSDIVYLDNDVACLDDDSLADAANNQTWSKRCNMRSRALSIRLEITSGAVSIIGFKLIVTEV